MFYKDTILEYLCVCLFVILCTKIPTKALRNLRVWCRFSERIMRRSCCQVTGAIFSWNPHKTLRDLRVSFVFFCSRSSCLIRVDNLDEICYNIRITQLDLFEILIMYHQLDYELDSHLDSSYSYTCHLDDHDEIYARRDTSYETLAIRHHVWYNMNT